ncbi:MAG: CRISPR-associated protein Cas4 [Candidatus Heimdallarchaeota archaeon]|nr:CRISPR-associated protein Cas4 [Candidatus Heimdallarchaeota archaeon]
MRITGIMIQYYKVCHTELWYFIHGILSDQQNRFLEVGRFIHQQYKKRSKTKEVVIADGTKIDLIGNQNGIYIVEVKKSNHMNTPKLYQLYYYLWKLQQRGIKARGILTFPCQKKTETVELSKEMIKELREIEKNIKKIRALPKPPKPTRKSFCPKCAYYELCWGD